MQALVHYSAALALVLQSMFCCAHCWQHTHGQTCCESEAAACECCHEHKLICQPATNHVPTPCKCELHAPTNRLFLPTQKVTVDAPSQTSLDSIVLLPPTLSGGDEGFDFCEFHCGPATSGVGPPRFLRLQKLVI